MTGDHLWWMKEFAREKGGYRRNGLERVVIRYDVHISPEEICGLRKQDNLRMRTEIEWPWEFVIRVSGDFLFMITFVNEIVTRLILWETLK
jgi:hypothetical protein